MRPRTEVGLATAALVVLSTVVLLIGSRKQRPQDTDARRSSFLTGPEGARGLADALGRLHVEVGHLRRRLDAAVPSSPDRGALLLVLSPARLPLTGYDARQLARRVAGGGDLLLAGVESDLAFGCFALHAAWLRDSSRIAPPGAPADSHAPWALAAFEPLPDSAAADSAGIRRAAACTVAVTSTDTLLVSSAGQPVALRVRSAGGGTAVLVADGALLSNRALRRTSAGEVVLGLIIGRYRRVVFDEYHHGFGPSGSLAGALVAWSARSPWGWAAWQLAIVGLLALAAGAVRFGPARHVIERRRRSPLEHVRALATALAAARGHDVAIAMQVQGLRRRLARGDAAVSRSPIAPWLDGLAANVRTPRARSAVVTLRSLTHGSQPAGAVLRAADAVEAVWDELKPR